MFTNTTGYHIDGTCDGEISWPLTTADLKDLESFTVRALVSIHDVFDGEEKVTDRYVTEYDNGGALELVKPQDLNVEMESFVWTVEEVLLKDMQSDSVIAAQSSFESDRFEMFGMKWFLEIYPNGDEEGNTGHSVMKVHVDGVSSAVKVVCVRYTICVEETDTKFISEGMFGADRRVSSWGTDRISTEKFKNLQSLKVTVELELVDVFRGNVK